MHHNNQNRAYSQTPNHSEKALVNLSNFQKDGLFENSIIQAAHNAGCVFLFEIPAALFGFEDTRAAAIKLNASQDDDQLAFILCSEETGQIYVLSHAEVPKSVRRFVASYARVLGHLKTTKITSH